MSCLSLLLLFQGFLLFPRVSWVRQEDGQGRLRLSKTVGQTSTLSRLGALVASGAWGLRTAGVLVPVGLRGPSTPEDTLINACESCTG